MDKAVVPSSHIRPQGWNWSEKLPKISSMLLADVCLFKTQDLKRVARVTDIEKVIEKG